MELQQIALSCDRTLNPDCEQCPLKLLHLKPSRGNFSTASGIEKTVVRLMLDPARQSQTFLAEDPEQSSFSVAALEFLGLTKREAEVLFWIAKDKSNAGIARVLGCCEGTVRKHLEHLYKKLGVQTRVGAIMVALERLGLLKGEALP